MSLNGEQGRRGPAGPKPPADLPADAASAGEGLPLAIAAWTRVDPEVAARLAEAWLATADGEGTLSPPCPVACQLVEGVADALPEPEAFLSRVLPGLARCLEGEFDRHDVRGTGLPHWRSAAEALFPAEYAPGRFTVDLAVLMSNEASSFCRLAEGRTDLERVIGDAEGERRELDDWLKETFWNEEATAFDRNEEGKGSEPDFSPCGFFPLIWEGLTEAMGEGLRTRAAGWDPSVWPARSWALFFALLLRAPHGGVVSRMRRAGLPAGASPAERAAWMALASGADAACARFWGEVPKSVRWLDAHGRGIARGSLLAGAALLAGLLVWGFFHRERSGEGAGDELERRARMACEEGEHARAAALYGQAARLAPGSYFRYRQAGEWMHLELHGDAEAAYREILGREPGAANARLNLALAVLKQGRREEALELYRAFAAEPAEAHPELTARAKLAAGLIEQQLALDRAAP